MKRCILIAAVLLCTLSVLTGCRPRVEKPFPSRAITIVCPPAPGGLSDTLTRALAASAQPIARVPVVVENKPGGANAVGLNYGAHAAPDGYTVTYVVAELAILPHLGLSPISPSDFDLLVRTNYNPAAVTVRADSKWRNLHELLSDARTQPESIRAGNSGTGSIWHLAAVALQEAGKGQFKHVPFGGAAPAVQALLGGHVDVVCVSPTEVQSHVSAGKLRVLAILSPNRDPLFPDVPSAKELGYDIDIGAWGGLALPKGVPSSRRDSLLITFREAFQQPEFTKLMEERGVRLAWLEGEAFRQFVQEQSDRNRQLVHSIGIHLTRGDVGHFYFPRLLAALVVLLALLSVLQSWWKHNGRLATISISAQKGLFVAGVTLAYVVLLPVVGFWISTAAFLFTCPLVFGRKALWQPVVYALLVASSVHWLFHSVLGVPLP